MNITNKTRNSARVITRLLAFSLAATTSAGLSAQTLKSGEQVYQQVCISCHASGKDDAPKFGSKKDWAPLIEEGQDVLTAHAWVGVRGMPAKGGAEDLTQEEFARAVAYMARDAGGSWQDPDARMMQHIRKEEKKRIKHLKSS